METLLNLELEMATFFEMTPDLACIAGRDGFFRKINPAVSDKLGYTEEELFARPIASFIHPEDKAMTGRERKALLAGKTLVNFQNRYVTKDGDAIWFAWTSVYFPDKEVVFAIAKDITESKRNEKDIEEKYKKFKGLARHFKASIEEDRKYLAVELHEELAQLAAVIKMDVEVVSDESTCLSSASKERLTNAGVVAGLLMNTIRRISFSLSPGMLEEMGLNETLEWHCREFSILNGVPCVFESSYNEADLSREIKLDFFRICQEALSNIMYHAQANNASIRIKDIGDEIRLTITDDGKGFDTFNKKHASGLISMRKRAVSINGQLKIQSETGKGTEVSVTINKR
jgi:PAS domain S-box-containing protein